MKSFIKFKYADRCNLFRLGTQKFELPTQLIGLRAEADVYFKFGLLILAGPPRADPKAKGKGKDKGKCKGIGKDRLD